jgi:serine-type D-Ala-D-Ala carboxypeptidase
VAEIRAAIAGDAGPMAEVFVRAWRDAYRGVVPDAVLASLDHEETRGWLAGLIARRAEGETDVADQGGRVIGFVRYGAQPDGQAAGYVFGLYVDPRASGQGVGQALLRHAERGLAERGCSAVALHVFEANDRARRLYAKSGYVPDGSSRIEPQYQASEIRLIKVLPPARQRRLVPPPLLAASYQSQAGRPAEGFAAVSRLLLRGLAAGVPPAVAADVRTPHGAAYSAAGGWARLAADGEEPVAAESGTLFDLASLTKVIVTLPLVLLLHQQGRWSIDDPVARWLPGAPRSPVTISDCLLHTAGLVPFRQYYRTCGDAGALKTAVIAELAGAVPRGVVSYSDVSFMLLGWAVEQCAGEPLASLFAREVAGPLGMASTCYRPQADPARIAATEEDGDQRLVPGLIWGTVHDGNAFALAGVSGHAGLFGTAADLGRYAAAWLRPEHHPVLAARTIELMKARQAETGDQARMLGWRTRPAEWGDWPAGTFWHTGFTGTSMLVAPALDAAVVLLTNAVHPVRRLTETAALRAGVHRAVLATLLGANPDS